MKIIRYADLVPMPWKNGGGVTREIARREDEGEFVWRLSIADVASEGPFSAFPGLRRILTVIDGPGMRLERPNLPALAANMLEPVAFSGNEPINGLLPNGPCRDFNVIWNPGLTDASVAVAIGQSKPALPPLDGINGILCLSGKVALSDGNVLAQFDFALLDKEDATSSFADDTIALLIRIRPVSKT